MSSSLYAPPSLTPPPSYTYTPHGSVGAVIGVLAVVLVLCVGAVLIGRFCSGRGIMGRSHYDMESWVETHCSSCVDGRIVVSRPQPRPPSPPPRPHSPPPRPSTATNEGGAHESTEELPTSNAGS